MDSLDLAQKNEDDRSSENSFKTKAALLVSVLAMVLAVSNIGSSNASSDSTEKNILAANTYSFYQAKNIRQTEYKLFSDLVQMELAKDPKMNAEARALMEKKLEGYAKNIQRYESEPETGEGKKELLQRAKEYEQIRDLALRKDPWFDYAEGLLQVGIVLASVAIVTSTPLLLTGSLVSGFLGMLCTLNGYFLLIG
jgi:Domain of unknown function (DUF4337)